MSVFQAADNVLGIDLYEEGRPGRSSAYLIQCREPVLVETGSARSHDALLTGLAELDMRPEDIRHIIVTHVHLDHAGGVGQMMEVAPEAILHCHPRAARHMIDPSRLISGAKAVYGDQMESMFGSLKPVPQERVAIQTDETVLDTGDRELIFYDTPGHAKHHCCVVDSMSRGIFSGDTVGIRYTRVYTGWDFEYGFPTTTPSDFDPDVMLDTLDRLWNLNLSRVYHTHFGVTEPAQLAFDFSRRGVEAIKNFLPQLSTESSLEQVEATLRGAIANDLRKQGRPPVDVSALGFDVALNSQGILVYLQKRAAGKL